MSDWLIDIQGYTTILDADGQPVERRRTVQFLGATVQDTGTITQVQVGAGATAPTGQQQLLVFNDFIHCDITTGGGGGDPVAFAQGNIATASSAGMNLLASDFGASHPGVLNSIDQAGGVGRFQRFWWGAADWNTTPSGRATLNYDAIASLAVVCRFSSISGFAFTFGLQDQVASSGAGTDNAIFIYDSDVDASLRTRTTSNGTGTNNTHTMPAANAWHEFRLDCTQSSVIFSIDGVVVATHTTNLPLNTTVVPYILWVNRSGSSNKSLFLDLLELTGHPIASRLA